MQERNRKKQKQKRNKKNKKKKKKTDRFAFDLQSHFDTSNGVLSQLAFWYEIKKKFKQLFNMSARMAILDFRLERF